MSINKQTVAGPQNKGIIPTTQDKLLDHIVEQINASTKRTGVSLSDRAYLSDYEGLDLLTGKPVKVKYFTIPLDGPGYQAVMSCFDSLRIDLVRSHFATINGIYLGMTKLGLIRYIRKAGISDDEAIRLSYLLDELRK